MQVRQATFWDAHRNSCSGELRQATDHFAPVDEVIEVVYEQAREVQFAGDNGVVDTMQAEADEKNTSSRFENSPNRACMKF